MRDGWRSFLDDFTLIARNGKFLDRYPTENEDGTPINIPGNNKNSLMSYVAGDVQTIMNRLVSYPDTKDELEIPN